MKYIIIILLAFIMLNCGSSPENRQKTLAYLEKSREFVSCSVYAGIHFSAKDSSLSKDESGKYFLDEKQYRRIYNSSLSGKFDSLAVSCGFKDCKDADSYVIEFKDDPEIKSILGKYVQELKDRKEIIDREVAHSLEKMNEAIRK
jgi:hypothetical protein